MSFNTALDSGQYNSLRGTTSASPSHQARISLSLCPNTVVLSAKVNQVTFPASSVQLGYDGASGDYTDIRLGMTVLVSHVDDAAQAFFTGRVRLAPSGILIYINETSAPFANDDYIYVIDDFRVWDVLPRAVNGVERPDYEESFRQLLPRIFGLKGAYADEAVSGVLELDFAPNVDPATDGATISSYLWDVGDGTITVGSATTKDITVEFPPGFRNVQFSATDSGGRTSIRHIPVWAHDDTYPVTLLDHGDLEVTLSVDEGPSGSVTAFAEIDDVLPNTLVCAWLDNEQYNGTAGHIFDNIALLGRLRREDNQTSYADAQQDATTRFEIEGPLQQLARLEVTSQQIENDLTPTAFNQVDTLTVWREIHLLLTEYSTFCELHSLDFDDTSDTFREKAIGTQQSNLLEVTNALANGINARLQMNAAGEAEVVRDGVMIATADRDGLVAVADWSAIDVLSFSIGRSHVLTVGRVDSSGGSYNATSKKVTPALAVAPGIAQNYPEGQQRLDNQVLAADQTLAEAETEIAERSGHALAKAQERDELTIAHPDGYWWLTPSLNQWYTITLDGSETARGIVLDTDTRWQLVSTTVTHELETGTRTVQAVYRRESIGTPGQSYRLPPQSSNPLTLPAFPAFPAFPALDIGAFYLPDDPLEDQVPPSLLASMGAHLLHDGNCAMYWTSTQVFVCNDFVKAQTPTWVEITPVLGETETVVACRFTLTSPPGILVMTNDSGAAATTTIDFTLSDGGFVADADPGHTPTISGVYAGGIGWKTTPSLDGDPVTGRNVSTLDIRVAFSPAIIVSAATMTYDFTAGTFDAGSIFNQVALRHLGSNVAAGGVDSSTDTNGSGKTVSVTPGFYTVDEIHLQLRSRFQFVSGGAGTNGLGVITELELTGGPSSHVWYKTNAFNPAGEWSGGDYVAATCTLMRIGATFADIYLFDPTNCDAYYSDDYGATFAAAVNVGTPPASAAGFDTQRTGIVTLGGAEDKVRIADTAGGSYADYTIYPTDAIPTAIYIPRYKFAGAANNGAGEDEPDYLTGSVVGDTGAGHSLWKVTSSGGSVTQIDATSGALGLSVGPNCLHIPWYPNAYQDILAILSFSGTRKLARSLNAGSSWAFSAALAASAAFITTRRSDAYRRQAFIANGAVLGYVSNYQASPPVILTRNVPTTATILGIDVLP